MDTRYQPPLEHPPSPEAISPEARGLFASGWCATTEECRITHLADQSQQLVSPHTWRALRELGASIPVQLRAQSPEVARAPS